MENLPYGWLKHWKWATMVAKVRPVRVTRGGWCCARLTRRFFKACAIARFRNQFARGQKTIGSHLLNLWRSVDRNNFFVRGTRAWNEAVREAWNGEFPRARETWWRKERFKPFQEIKQEERRDWEVYVLFFLNTRRKVIFLSGLWLMLMSIKDVTVNFGSATKIKDWKLKTVSQKNWSPTKIPSGRPGQK